MPFSDASASCGAEEYPPMRPVRLGVETDAYLARFIDRQSGINWAAAGNYFGFVHTVRKDYRKLRLKDVGYHRDHEDLYFCRHEATVPVVARALDLDLGHLMKLFKRAQRASLIQIADRQAHQDVRTDNLAGA